MHAYMNIDLMRYKVYAFIFCACVVCSLFCRRTADVRSVGYSELFVLSRDDVLSAFKDHPEAKVCSRKMINSLYSLNYCYSSKCCCSYCSCSCSPSSSLHSFSCTSTNKNKNKIINKKERNAK